MPNLGPDYDLAVRLKRLEDQVARMQANPLGQAFSATQSDGSIGWQVGQSQSSGSTGMRWYQGTTSSKDPNTGQHPLLQYLGELQSGGQPVDSGILWYRPDGTESGVVGNRGVQLLDHKGNQIFGSDEYGASPSGEGLRFPRIPLSTPAPTGTGSWAKTSATTMSTVAWSQFVAQHINVWWVGQAYADTGTNGAVQLQLSGPNGATVTGPSHAVTGGQFITPNDTLTLPAGFWNQVWTVNVQCEVTSGTGSVYCSTLNLYGLGSG